MRNGLRRSDVQRKEEDGFLFFFWLLVDVYIKHFNVNSFMMNPNLVHFIFGLLFSFSPLTFLMTGCFLSFNSYSESFFFCLVSYHR